MKIGVVSYFFPPNNSSGAQRWSKFSLYLKRKGYEVFILSAIGDEFGGLDWERYEELKRNFRVYSFKSSGGYRKPLGGFFNLLKFFVIPDSRLKFFSVHRKSLQEVITKENPDVVIISVPPFSSLTFLPRFLYNLGIPYVVDLRDVWFLDPRRKNKIADFLLERYSLKRAKCVLCINEYAQEEARLFNENALILPHFYDPEEYEVEGINHDEVWISHVGSTFDERDMNILLDIARELKVRLRLVGPGSERFGGLGPVSRRRAIVEMISANILIAIFGKTKDQRYVSSVKLFEYLGARKPIVVICGDGYIRRISEELGLGVCGFSKEEIKRTILEALSGKYRPQSPEIYSIENVGKILINALSS